MKYLIPYIILLLATPVTLFAKKDSVSSAKYVYRGSELLIGYGVSPTGTLFDGVGTGNNRTYELGHYTGALFATYRFHKNKKVSFGVTTAYENESGIWNHVIVFKSKYHGYKEYNTTFLGHYKKQYFTVSPEMTVTYKDFNHGLIRIYGTLGIGISYRDEIDIYDNNYYNSNYSNGVNSLGNNLVLTDRHFQFNMYFSPLGIHVGRKLGFFIENGLGYKGLINFGTTYKF